MLYDQKKVDELWDLVKDTRCQFFGNYIGLKEVEFNLPMDRFTKRNYEKHLEIRGMEASVSTNLDEVLSILTNFEITSHHLSCAANVGYGDDSAFCVHYKKPDDIRWYAVTVLGLNYITGVKDKVYDRCSKHL